MLGQKAPAKALGAAAKSGQVASSYIFSGTRGIGKTTLARIFAKTLNCGEGPAEDCCNACTACQEIREGRCLDVLEMDAATHTGIDDIRELRDAAQYPPGRERYRVFILDEAHQLSTAAWNGLLKVLEEPPEWCVFLFCTTEPHKIPATIESRSLHFAFRSPSPTELREHLARVADQEELRLDDEALDLLVKAADGSVRDGLSALDQVRALAGQNIDADAVRDALGLVPGEAIEAYVTALGARDARGALETVARLEEQGQDLRAFTAELLETVRKKAIACALAPGEESAFTTEQLVWFGRILDQLEVRLRQGGPQRALLDLATVRMSRMAGLSSLAEIIGRLDGSGGTGPASRSRRRPYPPASQASEVTPEQDTRAAKPSSPAHANALPSNGELTTRLANQVHEARPALGAILRRARQVVLHGQERLEIMLPPDSDPFWKAKLEAEEGRKVLIQAARLIGCQEVRELLITEAAAPAAAAPPPSRRSRHELLDEARRDPIVQALFERFGAVVLESRPHDG